VVCIHCVNGVENCLIVTIIFVFESFEQRRLFCIIIVARYRESSFGNYYFWSIKDAFMMEDAPLFLPHEDIF
jgi:hypothetical protein